MIFRCIWIGAIIAAAASSGAEVRIPASTAYAEPDPEPAGLHIFNRSGISEWTDPKAKACWFGEIKTAGKLDCSVALRLPTGAQARFRLSVAGKSAEAEAKGQGTNSLRIAFGSFEIAGTGYQRFTLESLNPAGQACGNIEALILSGPAAADAHFNLKPRRNAASVHLAYPTAGLTNIDAFYCEVTAIEDPIWTFYMACGWHRGYFGMQVNSPTERRIIFSVWDSGNEAVDRNKVQADNRVRLVGKGESVYAGDFGNEGTGGHSHLKFMWRTGEKQRFYITAKPAGPDHVIFSGYFFRPDKREWMLISSWNAPKERGYLRGLHSFSENFGGANGHLLRKALYGNQWVHTDGREKSGTLGTAPLPSQGEWVELTTATFSHDPTGKADRLDRFMGVEDGQFFLSHGGFVPGFTKFGEKFTRLAVEKRPADIVLPD
jgi:Domain of unknown function (DUF3472)/Domain of unknown function (DUF5077)